MLVVSHDREFLNNLLTSTLVFEENAVVKEYVVSYYDWERQKKNIELKAQKSAPKQSTVKVTISDEQTTVSKK